MRVEKKSCYLTDLGHNFGFYNLKILDKEYNLNFKCVESWLGRKVGMDVASGATHVNIKISGIKIAQYVPN